MQGYNNAAKANTTQISEMTFANGIEAQYNTLISKQQCICLRMLHYVHNMQSTWYPYIDLKELTFSNIIVDIR